MWAGPETLKFLRVKILSGIVSVTKISTRIVREGKIMSKMILETKIMNRIVMVRKIMTKIILVAKIMTRIRLVAKIMTRIGGHSWQGQKARAARSDLSVISDPSSSSSPLLSLITDPIVI